MFIQVIQGPCKRQDELRVLAQTWKTDAGPAPAGWLGGTFGFTDDDTFFGVVRFDSRETAMANSGRPEQGAWAEKLGELFEAPVEFDDYDDVTVLLDGGADDAGFVQIIRGRTSDPERAKAMLGDSSALRDMRPEIIGGTFAIAEDGTFTQTVAFTDEASARLGEQSEPPVEVREDIERLFGDAVFHDLREPWFDSPS